MRINRVSMTGFGPFKTTQSVDFDAFADDGIFLIGGKTGAGKSTILDAICFALYGTVPRYEGQAAAQTRLRSDHCAPEDPTRVELEFTVGEQRYLVRRSPEYERPKTRGDGFTTQKAEAELFQQGPDGGWVGLEAQLRTVGVRLAQIVQLSQEQFLQVILLAQNRFQEFLLARSEDRQSLLRTLFGTRRFDDYDAALQERRRELEAALTRGQGEVDSLARQLGALLEQPETLPTDARAAVAWMSSAVDGHRERLTAAEAEAARADGAWQTARAEHDRLAEVHGRQQRRAAALARREELAQAGADLEREVLDALAAAAAHVGPQGSLDEAAGALAELAGSLSGAVQTERTLPERERAVAAAEARREKTAELIRQAREHAVEWEAQLRALEPQLDEATAQAADEGAALEALRAITPVLEALTAAVAVGAAAEEAQRRELEGGKARTAASAALDELRERRLDGHAAELAAALVEGEPCPVCGSTQHPAKASWSGEPVTEDDLAAAEAALQQAEAEAKSLSRRAADARAKLAELQGAAAGHTLETATAAKAAAEARLTDARAAAARAAELRARRTKLTAQFEGHDAELERLTAESDAASAELASARTSLDQARQTVAAARGDFDAASARAGAVDESLRAVRRLATRRQEHEAALAGVEATLAEAELQELPDEPVELTEVRRLLAEASVARDSTRDTRTTLATRLETATGYLEAARAAHERSAELAERYEVVRRLAATVHGQPPNTRAMRLESFVLAAELEEIVQAANARLAQMTGGRYLLEHSDERAARGAQSGLGLAILDQHTGLARPTPSLSGGETFLASLALALGLAEVVTGRAGGVRLDTLFIDEGFGSLDSETLEIAMGTLDSLRAGGRTIGLISHVEAMKEQIPAKLQVEVADGGWSVIRQ
ncbi:AAA family ATPase [Gryllotalpicola ginsengisoli]|uniref:AAA family ATPase n=1 Tax=Gryllotalpicola ginsengisoli TaxID=444608 RepID=UPI0003B45738|nr:SMC family ATPase [Gryllotalpicola ginsengisoli]